MKTVYNLSAEYDRNAFNQRCEALMNAGDVIRLERVPKPPTGNQNRFYWALIGIISDATGFSTDEAHTVCKREAGLYYTKEANRKHKFLRSTADLDTKEMSDYIEKVREIGTAIGCYMPTADEYVQNWAKIETQY